MGHKWNPWRFTLKRSWLLWSWMGWEEVLAPKRKSRLAVYTEYGLNAKELLLSVAAGSAAIYLAMYLFYHSVLLSLIAAVCGLFAPRFSKKTLLAKRRSRLKLQFKEALFSLASSLAAGRSPENAFRGVLEDMKLLYGDPKTDILQEFHSICYQLDNSEPLESALRNFADRAGIDEITQFADALTTCKRSGGDLLEVMKRTSTIIGDRLAVEEEIMVLLAQKRFEAKVMMAVPFVFLGFLGFAAPDYMKPLYSGGGYALLTVALLVLLGCFWLMNRMMKIEL
ncbi:type II secretion system F family protein [Paenibacillus sp. GCM10027627]|uniref:type II secretion system F family protein n=1 Tax=unclassified Paenibacillus TaxID=185978 RepID=UPI003631277F